MECYYDSFWVRGEGSVRYTGFYGVFLGSAPSVSVEIYAILPEGFCWIPRLTGRYRLWALFDCKISIRCRPRFCIEFAQPEGCVRLVHVILYFPL